MVGVAFICYQYFSFRLMYISVHFWSSGQAISQNIQFIRLVISELQLYMQNGFRVWCPELYDINSMSFQI